ncbi:chorismate mutase [Sphingosinicella humi]|uniref:chorismate mutase n=1 Tax=Allosphingosinicella humi TaxID=2068657 RepID=A0A2U2J4P8_9SPHN|nr:chorismate mutase [Sphingosinicella humi]PWG03320.1 chorismate mutase [Sphingosinicella humi]
MTENRVKPADCTTMAEVRHGVDRLDEEIAARLAERFRYMEAAARIKPDRDAVRDERRKAEVIAKVKATAAREGGPAARIALLYDALVESSIAYEFERFDERSG